MSDNLYDKLARRTDIEDGNYIQTIVDLLQQIKHKPDVSLNTTLHVLTMASFVVSCLESGQTVQLVLDDIVIDIQKKSQVTDVPIVPTFPRSQLRRQVSASFNKDDLRTIAFDLNIDFENINDDNKDTTIINLIEYCERNNLIEEFVAACQNLRPEILK